MVSVFKANVTAHLGEGNGKKRLESAIYLHSINCSTGSKREQPVKTSPSCYLATAMAGKRDVGGNRSLCDKKPGNLENLETRRQENLVMRKPDDEKTFSCNAGKKRHGGKERLGLG